MPATTLSFAPTVFGQVVDGVARLITQAVGAAPWRGIQTPGVFRRKRPVLLESDIQTGNFPCIIVSPAPDGPRIVREWFGLGVSYGYPVAVVAFFSSNAIHTAMTQRYDPAATTTEEEYSDVMQAAEVIRNAVYRPSLPGLEGTIYDVDINVGPAMEVGGQNSKLYAVCGIVVTFHSSELRVA